MTFVSNVNWIKNTKFEKKLIANFSTIKQNDLFLFLFKYCQEYHETYWFDRLDEVFYYLELTLNGEDVESVLTNELTRIVEIIEGGMYEYCFSLNEISEALYLLVTKNNLTIEDSFKLINHVLQAYSCNEEQDVF